jgi:hypothetical protein
MTTAIIGVGELGGTLARLLAGGGEDVILAAKGTKRPQALADELGPLARAASVEDAIGGVDTVILAVYFTTAREQFLPQYAHLLAGKVVIDPTNPVGVDEKGELYRVLPEGQFAGEIVASLLPPGASYVKAFGTLAPAMTVLAEGANREPKRAVLFYATSDDDAAKRAEQLIRVAGYEPVKVGRAADARRIEALGGDLFTGGLIDLDGARAALKS